MFWNKKEEESNFERKSPIKSPFSEELSSNSSASEDDYQEDSQEDNSLPSFPDSPMNKGFSQSAIKDAINDQETEEEQIVGMPTEERNFKTVEMEESPKIKDSPSPLQVKVLPKPFTPQRETSIRLAPPPVERPLVQERFVPRTFSSPVQRNQDIFVKIEKFHAARRSLQSAQEQVEQIDELLRRIRETKMREEQELTGWEKEMSSLKARIQNVTENIFEKVE